MQRNALGPVCTLLFVLATFGLAIALLLVTTAAPPVEIDISGYGTCDGKAIRVANMSTWTQYPAAPVVEADPALEVVQTFEGRNSIVWAGDAELRIFRVARVREDDDGIVVTADRALHVQGPCHFTLDAISQEEWETKKCIPWCNGRSGFSESECGSFCKGKSSYKAASKECEKSVNDDYGCRFILTVDECVAQKGCNDQCVKDCNQ